jgi:hypothetical protein
MFVIINSTPTRINKSHLVDLYERVSWAAPTRSSPPRWWTASTARATARSATRSTASAAAASRRSGSCSRALQRDPPLGLARLEQLKKLGAREVDRFYERVRDFFKAAEDVGATPGATPTTWSRSPSHSRRCCACAPISRARTREPVDGRVKRWAKRLSPGPSRLRAFRNEGFYERFPAKGQVERVSARLPRARPPRRGSSPAAARARTPRSKAPRRAVSAMTPRSGGQDERRRPVAAIYAPLRGRPRPRRSSSIRPTPPRCRAAWSARGALAAFGVEAARWSATRTLSKPPRSRGLSVVRRRGRLRARRSARAAAWGARST